MTRGSAWISVLALFVAGVSIGALGMHLIDERREVFQGHPGPPRMHRPGPDGPPRSGFQRMAERLELSDEQTQAIRQILDEARRESDAIRQELRPRLEQTMQQTRDRIEAVLTPQQRQQLEQLRGENPRFERMFLGEGHHGRHRHRPPRDRR